MCGRLACTLCPDDIVNAVHKRTKYHKDEDIEDNKDKESKPQWIERQYVYKPTYNGAPTTVLPVMVHKKSLGLKINENLEKSETESNYCIIPMRWGMVIPNKPENSTFHTHNARIENVLNSGLYKPCLFSGKRCVILADGYYEWKTTQGKDHKEPFYLHFKSTAENQGEKNLVKFAGLFNTIQDESGTVKHTCSMLTKESTESLKWLHHRMPLFLNTPDDIDNWLNSKDVKYDEALKLLPDYEQVGSEFKLEYYQVDKSYVNNSSCNSEKCVQRISLKRKSNTLDGWLAKKKK